MHPITRRHSNLRGLHISPSFSPDDKTSGKEDVDPASKDSKPKATPARLIILTEESTPADVIKSIGEHALLVTSRDRSRSPRLQRWCMLRLDGTLLGSTSIEILVGYTELDSSCGSL